MSMPFELKHQNELLLGDQNGSAEITLDHGKSITIYAPLLLAAVSISRPTRQNIGFVTTLDQLSDSDQAAFRKALQDDQRRIYASTPDPKPLRVRRGHRTAPGTLRPIGFKPPFKLQLVKATTKLVVVRHGVQNGRSYLELGQKLVVRTWPRSAGSLDAYLGPMHETTIGVIRGFTTLT